MSATATKIKTLKLSTKDAVGLLQACGFATADKWADDPENLIGKLKTLPEMVKADPDTVPSDKPRKVLLAKLTKTVEAEGEIVLGDKKATTAKKPTKDTGKKKGNVVAKASSNGHAESNGISKDKFGSRLGTNAAKLNAMLTKKPQNMKELMEKSGVSDTMYNHCNALVAKGFVTKSDEGYALK